MTISALPTPPSRNDPTNFATRADAFLGALPTFTTEANALATEVNGYAVEADASARAAAAGASAPKWVSGTTYAQGAVVWSPITYQSYRRKIAGAGTTDPSSDTTNWLQFNSGDVTTTATQTLTNKSLSGVVLNDGYTEEVFTVSGTTPTLLPSNGSIQTWTLTANSTPTGYSSWNSGQSLTLMIDDGAGFSISWAGISWKTNNGTAPILNTTGFTVVQLWKVGTTIYGARVGDA